MSPESAALADARRRRAAMERGLRLLADAAAAPLKAPNWLTGLSTAADELRDALVDHIEAVEGTGGLLLEVEENAPRLSGVTNAMRDDHRGLLKQLDELAVLIAARSTESVHSVEIRRAATGIVRALEDHRQEGADLVYEAYAVDIGGQS